MQSTTVARLFFPLHAHRYAVEDLQLRSEVVLPLFVPFVVPQPRVEQRTKNLLSLFPPAFRKLVPIHDRV